LALVVGIVDADSERRGRFVRDAGARLDDHRRLARHRWDHGDLTLLAAVADSTPLHQSLERATWTWVLGDVYAEEGSDPARFLGRRVGESGPLETHGQGGYYLACTMEASGRVTLGTDTLGLFPLYFWSSAEVLLFSTLPGLVHLHPDCDKRVSEEGLAGILLQSYPANGQTVWEGVHRPEPGRAVQWRAGAPAQTPVANPLVPSEAHFGLDYGPARRLFDATLHDAVSRSTRRFPEGMLLSGGMDSRLLAGHLDALRPGATAAVIFGEPGENEVRCAGSVAEVLDMPVVHFSSRFDRFGAVALAQLGEEHLSNTFHDFGWISDADRLVPHCRDLVNGFLGDPIMGGSLVPPAYNEQRGIYDFEALFARGSEWGFSPEEIDSLIKALPMTEAVTACTEQMRAAWDMVPGLPFQKATLWGLYHRGRYHVGAYAWRLARFVWPVMPYVDRAMLETGLGMPLNHLSQRQMQIDTLKSEYRRLAVLPVDRNARETPALVESLPRKAGRLMGRWLGRLSPKRRERRTYYRQFDINNPGWSAIRRLAVSRQASAHRLFHAEALARYVPSPEEPIVCADAITDSARLKTLLGLMMLSDRLME
jgi:asparagine synthase (glutamine-hydrolysing)